jgi:hypothetical protein
MPLRVNRPVLKSRDDRHVLALLWTTQTGETGAAKVHIGVKKCLR